MCHPIHYLKKRPILKAFFLLAALACLFSLFGCGEEDKYKKVEEWQKFRGVEVPDVKKLGDTVMFGRDAAAETPKSLEHTLTRGTTYASDGDITAEHKPRDQYFFWEADGYFALNEIKKQLDMGIVPHDLQKTIRDIQRHVAKIRREDGTVPQMREVLHDLQEGLDAKLLHERFTALGMNPEAISWGLGKMALEDKFKGEETKSAFNSGGFPSTRSSTALSMDSSLKQEILNFEARYHAAPQEVSRNLFREASTKIDLIGNQLDLKRSIEDMYSTKRSEGKIEVKLPNPGLKAPIVSVTK